MDATFYLLIVLILLPTIGRGLSIICPAECECFLDGPGRNKVVCGKGGLIGPLDVSRFDVGTEVLEITAPEHNFNSLMIGPIFQMFTHLEEIHLDRSNIPEIGSHSFWRLPSLRLLSLRDNNITTVLDNNFRGLPNLEKLYLDGNRIDRLSSGTFKYLTRLRVLSLTNNRLDELVTRVFEKLTKLQELNLSGNLFQTLNTDIFIDIQELNIFECRSCGLKDIDSKIYQFVPQLTTLDLGANLLTQPGDLIHLPSVHSLWLDQNQLRLLPLSTFAVQLELVELNVARNGFAELLPNVFENLTKLTALDLSYNNLKYIEVDVVKPFAAVLQRFTLSGNHLRPSVIGAVIRQMRRVVHLGLAEMDLSELPLGLFDYNGELLSLDLSRNHFVHFPLGVLAPVARLRVLDFRSNYLRGLDETSLLRLETLWEVQLDRNLWACDLCHLQPILQVLNRTDYLRSLKCRTPRNLRNRAFGSLQPGELKFCRSNDLLYDDEDMYGDNYFLKEGHLGTIAAGAGLLLLILTVAALLGGVCYSRRHAANYYTHEEKRAAVENDPIFDNSSDIHSDISFQFPMEKKIAIATIDEMKRLPEIPTKRL